VADDDDVVAVLAAPLKTKKGTKKPRLRLQRRQCGALYLSLSLLSSGLGYLVGWLAFSRYGVRTHRNPHACASFSRGRATTPRHVLLLLLLLCTLLLLHAGRDNLQPGGMAEIDARDGGLGQGQNGIELPKVVVGVCVMEKKVRRMSWVAERERERERSSSYTFLTKFAEVSTQWSVSVRARGSYSRLGSLFFLSEIRILYALLWLSLLQIAREFLRVVFLLISLYIMAATVPINQEYTVAVQISNIPATD
jgi:hypothetical protein